MRLLLSLLIMMRTQLTPSCPSLELVIHAYIDRLKELSAKPYVKYVSIFRNYGKEAGAHFLMHIVK